MSLLHSILAGHRAVSGGGSTGAATSTWRPIERAEASGGASGAELAGAPDRAGDRDDDCDVWLSGRCLK